DVSRVLIWCSRTDALSAPFANRRGSSGQNPCRDPRKTLCPARFASGRPYAPDTLRASEMNVLQLISSSLGYYGAERVVVTLSSALEEMGVTSVVAAFDNTSKEKHTEVVDEAGRLGLRTEAIPCQGRVDWNAVGMIRKIVERHNIDVIHCHGIKPVL